MKELNHLLRRARFIVGEAVGDGEEAEIGAEDESAESAMVVFSVEEADAEAAGEGEGFG
ncbi:hypothetical protein MA16_Dca029204 [Dendrobium catenatum]|uniref:Uncharacterized protein n=1 Tax=Dendrobium catenatum TaxID=906689 RepID=A0A2I0V8T1_9ASPA|nr:hypothetical protein MA16_Dca029204 [Dendrobium catenatum]